MKSFLFEQRNYFREYISEACSSPDVQLRGVIEMILFRLDN